MSESKKGKKKILLDVLRVTAFILALILALNALSATVFSKDKADKYSDTKYYYSSVYKNEALDTIDVGFFGNSDLYSGVIPLALFYQYGITSAVCASPRQDVNDSYWYIEDFMADQTPDIVVLESDMLYNTPAADFYKKGEPEQKGLPTVPFLNDNSVDNAVEYYFPVFRFHDRWKEYIRIKKSFNNAYMHGYYYNSNVYKNVRESTLMGATDLQEPIAEEYLTYVNMVKALCDSYGAQLVFLEIATPASWSMARHNAVQALADELEVPFLDLNLPYKDFAIDITTDYRDNGNHVNYNGAKKVTEYVGLFLEENFGLTDHREDADYAHWYDDLERMYEEYEIAEEDRVTPIG